LFSGSNKRQLVNSGLIISAVFIIFILSLITGFTRIIGIYFVFPILTMRITTGLSAILCFSIVVFLQRRRTLASIYYAIVAVIFSMALYELIWFYSGVALWGFEPKIFQFAALFGWIMLGIREVYEVKPPRVSSVLYGVYAISMFLWVATGFQFNVLGDPNFTYWGEFLNVVSKASIDFGYALHIGLKKSR
jgi:hypothetical protein